MLTRKLRKMNMPLLDPPKPEIPKRRFRVKIDAPLAITMEKYVEFLQADSIDHVITQALDSVFRKETDFKAWLANGSRTATSAPTKVKRARPVAKGKELESEYATAQATI
jgi:hypothetical protein